MYFKQVILYLQPNNNMLYTIIDVYFKVIYGYLNIYRIT